VAELSPEKADRAGAGGLASLAGLAAVSVIGRTALMNRSDRPDVIA